jgi:polar amino acid transport system permease protein
MTSLWQFHRLLLSGAWLTVVLAAASIAWGTALGVVLGSALLTQARIPRWLGRIYTDLVRGIPSLVLLFAIYYGSTAFGKGLNPVAASIVALGLFCAAQVGENIRGAVSSVPPLTIDAARMLGLGAGDRIRYVIVPLAIGRILPSWVNTAVEILKGTSLASLIGAQEFLFELQNGAGVTFTPVPFYLAGGAVYLVAGVLLSSLSRSLERRFRFYEY